MSSSDVILFSAENVALAIPCFETSERAPSATALSVRIVHGHMIPRSDSCTSLGSM